MLLRASLLLLALPLPAAAQEPPVGEGPRGSSNEARYDAVGLAQVGELAGVSAAGPALTPGSFAEVTALDSGRTIVVAVVEGAAGTSLLTLSPRAAGALGLTSEGAVRVRPVSPPPEDVALLRSGQPATSRMTAPPALLAGLRRRLAPVAAELRDRGRPPAGRSTALTRRKPGADYAVPSSSPARAAPVRSSPVSAAPRPAATRTTPAAAGLYVQLAALANAARARALAGELGGTSRTAGPLTRVYLGPFASRQAAEAARVKAQRTGYPGAQIVQLQPR